MSSRSPRPSRPAKPRKNYKSKSFSGCWTCRSRRLKCEEARPVCRRCTAASLECAGYQIRLLWRSANQFDGGAGSSGRSLEDSQTSPSPSPLQLPSPPTTTTSSLSLLHYRHQRSSNETTSIISVSPELTPTPMPPSPRRLDLVSVAPLQRELVHHWIHYVSNNVVVVDFIDNPYRVLYVPFACEGLLSPDTPRSAGRLALFNGLCAVAAESLLSLGVTARESQAQAKSSSWDLLAAQHAGMAVQNLQLAICSDHARPEENRQRQDCNHVQQRDDAHATMAAVILAVMRDSIAGRVSTWRGHVRAALELVRLWGGPSSSSISSGAGTSQRNPPAVVEEQVVCLAVFANLQPCPEGLANMISRGVPDEGSYLARNGITKPMLRYVCQINSLVADRARTSAAQHRHPSSRQLLHSQDQLAYSTASPAEFEVATILNNIHDHDEGMDDLELQLEMSVPTPPHFNNNQNQNQPQNPDTNIIYHYSHVFYYAILLYFRRVLRGTPPQHLQHVVDLALTMLEKSDQLGAQQLHGCPSLWPCLVIATECTRKDLQDRMLEWFATKKKYGFNSVDMGMDICIRYWTWREENSEVARWCSWQDFVKWTRYDVVPL